MTTTALLCIALLSGFRVGPIFEVSHRIARSQTGTPRPQPDVQEMIDLAVRLETDEARLPILRKALDLAREKKDASGEGVSLYFLGLASRGAGSHRQALEYFVSALPLFRRIADHEGYSWTLLRLGTTWVDLGEYNRARDIVGQSLPLWRQLKHSYGEALTLTLIGDTWATQGEIRRAIEFYGQALTLQRQDKNASDEVVSLNRIGESWLLLGEYRKALIFFEPALALAQRIPAPRDSPAGTTRFDPFQSYPYGVASSLNNVGLVHWYLGEDEKALAAFEQALPLARKVKHVGLEASILHNVGLVYADRNESTRAVGYFEMVLPLLRSIDALREASVTASALARCWTDLGDHVRAREIADMGLTFALKVGDPLVVACAHNAFGVALLEAGDSTGALGHFHQALVGSRSTGDTRGEAAVLFRLGLAWEHKGVPSFGVAWHKLSVNAIQRLRHGAIGISSTADRTLMQALHRPFDSLAGTLQSQSRIAEAMQVLAMQEVSGLREATRGNSATSTDLGLRLSLTRLEKKWLDEYEARAKPLGELGKEREELVRIKERLPDQQKRLKALDKALEAAQKEFQFTLDAMAKAFENPEPNANDIDDLRRDENLASLAADLGDTTGKKTAIIATLVARDKFFVLLTLPSASPKMLSIPVTRAELAKAVTEALRMMVNPGRQPYDACKKVYDWVIAPIADDLRGAGIDCLMFNLNGPLRYMPMAALFDGERYLAERFQVTNFSLIARQYLENEPPKLPWKSAFLGVTQEFDGFPALGGVERETREGASLFGTAPKLNEAFDASALDALLKGRDTQLIHFGTHFRLAPGSNDETFMLLGNGEKWRLSELETSDSLGFRGVELLVAAACETGVPTGDDSSIEGFGAYCQIKGAKSVLSTLWKVSDQGTSRWMSTFYKILAAGKGKGEAFHRAQLAMISGEAADSLALPKGGTRSGSNPPKLSTGSDKPFEKDPKRPFAHPFYWAPFTLSGNWR